MMNHTWPKHIDLWELIPHAILCGIIATPALIAVGFIIYALFMSIYERL